MAITIYDTSSREIASIPGDSPAGANISNRDLRGAWLGSSESFCAGGPQSFQRTNFNNSNLDGAISSWHGMAMDEATFQYARMRRANFSQCSMNHAKFTRADVAYTCFYGANLRGADFSGANLHNVDFSNCCLVGADFSGANLCNLRLARADVRGANFTNTQLSATEHIARGLLYDVGAICDETTVVAKTVSVACLRNRASQAREFNENESTVRWVDWQQLISDPKYINDRWQ